jgi:hypothetical protein
MAHTFTSLLTHVVFSTSGRTPLLVDTIRPDVHAYLGGILREMHASPSRSAERATTFIS